MANFADHVKNWNVLEEEKGIRYSRGIIHRITDDGSVVVLGVQVGFFDHHRLAATRPRW